MKRFSSLLAALWLAFNPLLAVAQIKVGAVAAETSSTGAPSAAISSVIPGPATNVGLPTGSLSLSVPSLAPAPIPVSVNAAVGATAVTPVQSVIHQNASVSIANPSRKVTPSVAVKSAVLNPSAPVSVPITRSEKAVAVVRDEVANWGVARHPEDSVLAPPLSRSFASLSPVSAAATPQVRGELPAPRALAPNPGSPRISRAILITGSLLLSAAAVSAFVPALLPAVILAYQAPLTWSGLALLAASRFFRVPGTMPDAPAQPPAKEGGYYLGTFKALWAAAKATANSQIVLADRVGGNSWSSFRDWFLGGIRTGLYWLGVSLMTMLAGAALVKIPMLFAAKSLAVVAPSAPSGLAAIPFFTFINSFMAPALAQEAGVLAAFFGVRWIARRLGAGKASPWIGGAVALGLAAVPLLMLTTAPMVVAASLALEAGVIWTAARSDSWVSALALRGIISFFSIESARLVASLAATAGGAALIAMPAVWGGVLVGLMALLAWRLKSPGLRLTDLGIWWRTPEPGGRPKSPWAIISSGLVWGLAVYSIGDLSYWAVNYFLPGSEPAPAILAKMLTSGLDLVLFNFVLVGLIEEYVFRRGLYKSILNRLEKWKIPATKAFWLAAISSGLIFSGVHYIDWGAMLAHIGIGSGSAAAVAGAYAFSWAGFISRAVLGVVLAGLYRWSGILLVPIAAHFWADTMEGLGLRWGFPAFLALAAGALILSFLFRPKPKSS